jgi:drug/metabolite transporter (DMT)-like permease
MILPAVFFTAFSSIFIRWNSAPALTIAFYRMLFTVGLVAPYVLSHYWLELRAFKFKKMLFSWASGFFLAFHFSSWIASLSLTSVAASTVLVSCSPIVVTLFEMWFHRKKPSLEFLAILSLALIGTFIITQGGWHQPSHLSGNLLALFGGVCMAGYLLLGAEVQKESPFWVYILHVYSASLVFLGLMMMFTKTSFSSADSKDLMLILAMTIFCSLLGHTVYNWLLRYYGATTISLATLCEPLFASVLAYLFLRETPTLYTLIGGSIVLLAVSRVIVSKKT